jgi:hypothetical protein
MRPDHVSRLYVALAAWAIDRGCLDDFKPSPWTHKLGEIHVVAHERAFHLAFAVTGQPAVVAVITATEERWDEGFESLAVIVELLLAEALRGHA